MYVCNVLTFNVYFQRFESVYVGLLSILLLPMTQ